MMRSRSDYMLQGIEYMNWYQIIRPIGFSINERSRFEILKVADESDLRLRDSVPWWLRERPHQEAMLNESDLQKLATSKQSLGRSNEVPPPASSHPEEQDETETYLSPRLKEFHDENKEIEEIFWELLKSVHPTCPDDLDLQAIRNALAERQAKLGRDKKEPSEEDIFDKYGLGLNARRQPYDSADTTGSHILKPPKNELFDMIDKMAAERMKPVPKRSDGFDKNNPITGKVGFRRDEQGEGPRTFTDLDEILSFGDPDRDADFKKYLVNQNRGRYDSKGNFFPGRFDSEGNFAPGRFDSKGNFIAGIYDEEGNFIQGKYGDKGRFIQGIVDSKGNVIPARFRAAEHAGNDVTGESKRKNRKRGKKKKGDTDSTSASLATSSNSKGGKSLADMTEEERGKYLENLRKSERHPEIDYPGCNYPKWVHRMYRMDQVKFGQLIKQRTGVPEYTPSWMLDTLDKVWGTKDPMTRGVKPSNDPKLEKSRFRETGWSKRSVMKGKGGSGREGELGKKGSWKAEKGSDQNQQGKGGDGEGGAEGRSNLTGQPGEGGTQGDGYGKDKGLTEDLGGLADFLQGYEKEMVDLAKLDAEAGTDKKAQKIGHSSFDIDDLIDQYHDELLRDENLHKQDRDRFYEKDIMEEKAKKIKERQEAALKKIQDKEDALKQQDKLKEEAKKEKAMKHEAQREDHLKDQLNEEAKKEKAMKQEAQRDNFFKDREQKRQATSGPADKHFGRTKLHGKSRKGVKGKEFMDRKAAAGTEPCAEFKASKLTRTRDDECMKRFEVLLGGQRSRFFGGTDFIHLAQQIALIRYPPSPSKKTPCELVEVPICR